jgi:hypothetical protein
MRNELYFLDNSQVLRNKKHAKFCFVSFSKTEQHFKVRFVSFRPMSMSILHVLYMSMVTVHIHGAFPCPWCMSMSMVHVHVHAACLCPRCVSMYMLHVYVHSASVYAACPCLCCTVCLCLCSCCMSMYVVRPEYK